MKVTGGCLCGAVRYHIDAEPSTSRACWCRVCQRIGAGSGNRMHRRFCPSCGVHLFSEAEARPHLIFVRAGTLDDPEIGRPLASIWLSQAPSWACIDDQLLRFDGQPPAAR